MASKDSPSHTLWLPLGNGRLHDEDDLRHLQEVLRGFRSITFYVSRTSERAFTVRMVRTGVPTAQQSYMDMDDTVSGLLGDTFTLMYRERIALLTFDAAESRLMVRIYQK